MLDPFLFDAIIVLCLLIWFIYRDRPRTDRIPGPRIYPIIGNLPDLIHMKRRGVLEYLQERREKYGTIYKLRVLNNNFFVISDPDYIKTLLSSSENLTKPFYTAIFDRWTGQGLGSSTGASWHRQRKLMDPKFSTLNIKSFIPNIIEKCERMCDDLNCFKNQEIDLLSVTRDVTVKLAYDHFFSVTLEESKLKEIANDNGELLYIILGRFLRPWLWSDFFYSLTTNASREEVLIRKLQEISMEAISMRKANNNRKLDSKIEFSFLDYLIEQQKEDSTMSDEDIRTQLDSLVFSLMNLLPMATSMVLYFVASDDSVQADSFCSLEPFLGKVVGIGSIILRGGRDTQPKLIRQFFSRWVEDNIRSELNNIFSHPLSSERVPTMDELSRLKYLDSVISETLRFIESPAFGLGRLISKEIKFKNYVVPAGSTVFVDWNSVHRDEKYYSKPNEFNPEHFYNPEEAKHRPLHTFLPFGKSLRICIAEKYSRMVMKLVIASIIQNFQIESSQSLETLKKSQLRGLMKSNDRSTTILIKLREIVSS